MESTWDTNFRDSTRSYVQFVFVPVIVTIGVVGNIVTIYVLNNKRQPQFSSNLYITALAVSDTIYLFGSFTLSLQHYPFWKTVRMYWKYLPVGLWITDASSSTSAWLIVCYTIERYIAVCHPMALQMFLPRKRSTVLVICVCIGCCLLTASTPWEWKVATAKNKNQSTVSSNFKYKLENTSLGQNIWYRFIFHWFSTIVFVLVPLIILIFGNRLLISAVRTSRKLRHELINCHHLHHHQNRMIRKEQRLSVSLIVIVTVFLVCQTPTALVLLYTSVRIPEKGSPEDNVLLGLGNICNMLVAANAAANFMLYTAISGRYRNDFLRMCDFTSVWQRWKRRNTQPTVVVNHPSEYGSTYQQADDMPENSLALATSEIYLDSNLQDAVVLTNLSSYKEGGRKQNFSFHSWASTTV